MSHKYKLDQSVLFSPSPGEIVRNKARGKITRLLPKQDDSYQYRIHLEAEDQERRVQEDQLEPIQETGGSAWPQQAGAGGTGQAG